MDEWGIERGQGQEHTHSWDHQGQEYLLKNAGGQAAVVWARNAQARDICGLEGDEHGSPGSRCRGRPKKRWKDVVGEDMKEKGVEAGYVNDRRWWRELIRNSDPP